MAAATAAGSASGSGGARRPGSTHSTARHSPSCIAAAARHAMATALVPPRSTVSAKPTCSPRYSATTAGTKAVASLKWAPFTASPSMSCRVRPASISASRARSAICSRWNIFGAVAYFSGRYWAQPTIAALPVKLTGIPLVMPFACERIMGQNGAVPKCCGQNPAPKPVGGLAK